MEQSQLHAQANRSREKKNANSFGSLNDDLHVPTVSMFNTRRALWSVTCLRMDFYVCPLWSAANIDLVCGITTPLPRPSWCGSTTMLSLFCSRALAVQRHPGESWTPKPSGSVVDSWQSKTKSPDHRWAVELLCNICHADTWEERRRITRDTVTRSSPSLSHRKPQVEHPNSTEKAAPKSAPLTLSFSQLAEDSTPTAPFSARLRTSATAAVGLFISAPNAWHTAAEFAIR